MEGIIQSVGDIGLEKIDKVLICVYACVEGEMTNKHHLSGGSSVREKNEAVRGVPSSLKGGMGGWKQRPAGGFCNNLGKRW